MPSRGTHDSLGSLENVLHKELERASWFLPDNAKGACLCVKQACYQIIGASTKVFECSASALKPVLGHPGARIAVGAGNIGFVDGHQ